MFLQYLERLLFWQPSSRPDFLHSDARRLSQELDAARREVAQCQHKILSLSAKLEECRRIICVYRASKAPSRVPRSQSSRRSITGKLNRITPKRRDSRSPSPTSAIPPSVASIRTTIADNPPPGRSVVYNPQAPRSLKVNVAHVFKYATEVRCLKFSPDGKHLAIGLQLNGKTHIYDVKTGKEKCVLLLSGHYCANNQVSIRTVDFSPDSKCVATGGSEKQICIWDTEQRKLRAMFKKHTGDVHSVAFSSDGRFLVSSSYDKSVRIWRLRDGSSWILGKNSLEFYAVRFSPDGRFIAAASSDKTLRIWQTRTRKMVAMWTAHTEGSSGLAFTSDGKGLISGSSESTIKYWDISSIGLIRSALSETSPSPREIRKFEGHTASVRSLAFLPKTRLLVSSSNDRSLRIWDADTAKWQCTLQGHEHRIPTVDCSQTGEDVASGSLGLGEVILWKVEHV